MKKRKGKFVIFAHSGTYDKLHQVSTISLTAAGTTPSSVFRLPDYPGFTVTANNAVANTFNTGGEAHVRGPASISRLRLTPADTITPRNIVNGFMPQWQEATTLSVKTAAGG